MLRKSEKTNYVDSEQWHELDRKMDFVASMREYWCDLGNKDRGHALESTITGNREAADRSFRAAYYCDIKYQEMSATMRKLANDKRKIEADK